MRFAPKRCVVLAQSVYYIARTSTTSSEPDCGMEFKERAGRSLAYIAIEPDGYDQRRAYPMVVLLHGFGSHMGDLAGLCAAIDRERYVYICPNAPISMEIGPGMTGYAWTRLEEPYAEDGDRAEEMLAELFDEVMDEYRTEAGAAMLGGFSQGGMMTYSAGLVAPERFRGLAALSGRVPDPDRLRERLPDDRGQAILIAHGTADSVIGVEEARRARRFLEEEGYRPVYKEYPMAHEISYQVLDDLVAWVRGLFDGD